ncbi:zinc finger protein CONSTANS-LIKE 16-like [Punica granatum]|uniref:Zinc finger protein CONSTANS-LIKE 16-like n=1 Tax=Punica granatum TaxID=22663 RepID=A0A6P8DQZ7_PUNGR|nr:zinc finger protein CONSTANS-LIKE 16-like [Punica granatum]
MHGFLPSDMDLAEFAADVESLLGKGLENESFGMEGLELMDWDCRNQVKDAVKKRQKIFLKLDYESVIESWSSQGSPWTSSDRPDLNSDDY